MNRKSNVIGFAIEMLVFIILWIFFLSILLTAVGNNYIAVNNPSGVELMFYSNLNIVIGAICILCIAGYNTLFTDNKRY